MTDPFRLDDFLPYQLAELSELTSARLANRYGREYGLTVPEWRVLAHLHEHGALRATDVGRRTNMHKVKVSRAVTELVARGWVDSRPSPGDARARDLALTRAGRAVMRRLVPLARAWERDLLSRLPARDRAAAGRVLRSLRAAVETME